ncbi:2OG-Fe dioxygenase family protein [Amycolatopsis sp. CA-128772]|uniref:2OG-Fe dioxygenase family protein n=1 Tax=Amycolatopsis sp. CA-128772 TaxID=2073159 RepID=UPI000CD0543D|nr:2OG-Fe dioxygenase family protein [Amycolatopsis sp. CA-128772]
MAFAFPGTPGEDLRLARKQLDTDGYLVVSDDELGLPGARLREHLLRTYFTRDVLRCYPGDIPADRERARDVVEYAWHGEVPELGEHPEIAIEDRGGRPERREYDRTPVVGDPLFASWIRAVLGLLPEHRRRPRGTFGVNLFRTFTNVVTRPHADGEEFVFVYVVDRDGTGAETTLYRPEDPETPVHTQRLEPGQLIVFEDRRFLHTASPLIAPPGRRARRDALVCTVDYPQTYGLG